jgi:hypothetical protein
VAGRPPIFRRLAMLGHDSTLLSSSTSSCSYHADSTNKKYQKQSKFLSSFSKVHFIYLFDFFDFILCNDEINMRWERSK